MPGDIVFRKLPYVARLPKHYFPNPTAGPFIVERQHGRTSVTLRDPQKDELVDDGAKIPLDQIVAGPDRSELHFDSTSDT